MLYCFYDHVLHNLFSITELYSRVTKKSYTTDAAKTNFRNVIKYPE